TRPTPPPRGAPPGPAGSAGGSVHRSRPEWSCRRPAQQRPVHRFGYRDEDGEQYAEEGVGQREAAVIEQPQPAEGEHAEDERAAAEDGPEAAVHLGLVDERLAAAAGLGEADQGGDHGDAEETQLQDRGRGEIHRRETGDHREHARGVPTAVPATGRAVDDLVAALGDLRETGAGVVDRDHRNPPWFYLPARKVNTRLSWQASRNGGGRPRRRRAGPGRRGKGASVPIAAAPGKPTRARAGGLCGVSPASALAADSTPW